MASSINPTQERFPYLSKNQQNPKHHHISTALAAWFGVDLGQGKILLIWSLACRGRPEESAMVFLLCAPRKLKSPVHLKHV